MFYTILGGPASGKGTRAKVLCKELNIPHISTGELLRKLGETDEAIKEKLTQGMYISDEITTKLLYDRITELDCSNGCVIDGYPRNINQVYLLDDILNKLNAKLTAAISLKVPDELAISRILSRKICSSCGRNYSSYVPSVVKDVCDDCKGKLVRRSDDNEETLKKRIKLYKTNAQPILDYYQDKGLLVTVDASKDPSKILDVISK